MRLHDWAFATESCRRQHGEEGGERNADSDVVDDVSKGVGAYIMGRRMFGGGVVRVRHQPSHLAEQQDTRMNKTPAARAPESGDVATRLPAPGPKRTRRYYAEKLGLEPIEEHPARTSLPRPKGEFAIFESAGNGKRPEGSKGVIQTCRSHSAVVRLEWKLARVWGWNSLIWWRAGQ